MEADDVQHHVRLRQMIISTFDGIEKIDYDAVYEDIAECMEHEKSVKYFPFLTPCTLVQ